MPIIIDGWNLIRCERSGIRDDETESLDAAASLMALLARFQEAHRDPIIVVFDSSSGHLGIAREDRPDLSVVAAKDADLYIKKYIDKIAERQRRNLRVITSDNDVYYYAKSAYATPVRSEDFWDTLEKRPGQARGRPRRVID